MLRINPERMRAAFDALAEFGATPEGGVHRPTFSEAHLAARKWYGEQIEQAGLQFRADGAGNYSALLPSSNSNAQTLFVGSHLDSVPHGGRFDGALGVMAAFEIMRSIKEAGVKLAMNLEAIDFTDEEGTLVGLLGSAALAGRLKGESLRAPRGGRGALMEGLKRAGLTEEGLLSAGRDPKTLGGYLELHIEQGKRLEQAGINIGIVTSIVGIASYRVIFIGRADHAGTTTMRDRRDAAQGASAFTLAAREIVMRDFPECVVNVGKMEFEPGAFNIVPSQVVVSLEFRAPSDTEFKKLDEALIERARAEAQRFDLDLRLEFVGKHSPTPISEKAQEAFAQASDSLGLTHMPLTSGAGHDAQSLAKSCPVGMIFVPSVDGASHSPRESTKWEDCVNGANVLLHAVLNFAS